MNIFQKLSFISKVQKAIKEVKAILAKPETEQTANNISGGVNKIKEGINDIKKEVPSTTNIANQILEALSEDKQG